MRGRRLPDRTMPERAGDYWKWPDVVRPPHASRTAWFAKDPHGLLLALIPEVHRVTEHAGGAISVTPSIVSPRGGYHGFLVEGAWS